MPRLRRSDRYPPPALSAFLMLNILFGTIGHTGVETLAPSVAENLPFRWLGTSRFHMTHHEREETDFGFYTVIWDSLFRTLLRRRF